jgi:nicotinamidase-related amidase
LISLTTASLLFAKSASILYFRTSFQVYSSISKELTTVVFTGIATEYGIESSARDASSRGFYSVVVSDCVSSPDKNGHTRPLENMKKIITIISSKEIENIWSK